MCQKFHKSHIVQQLILGVLLSACLLSSSVEAALSASAAAAVAQQQTQFMTVVLSNVQPLVETRYSWQVKASASVRAIQVPVDSSVNWPEVRYNVTYTRGRAAQIVYTLSGQILISTKDRVASAILLPDVTVTTGAGKVFQMPEEAIQCPSLVVPAGGSLTCNFAASYAGRQPMPGTVAASVKLAGVLIPITLDAAPVPYDFSRGDVVETGAFGTASNYFEMGAGIIQPYGVYGEQPPPGLRLEDSRTFSFVAVFGNVPSSKCGRQYKAVNTAELSPSSSEASVGSAVQSSQANVSVTLTGCDGPAEWAEAPSPVGPAAPVDTGPPAVTPPAAPAPATVPTVPGVSFAQAGSTLCGTGVCPQGSRCFDGWNCCPEATPICGGTCCQSPNVCISNKCVPLGSTPCGTTVCTTGQICGQNNVCCAADQVVCGATCCASGQSCVQGVCAAAGSVPCGQGVCSPGQSCVGGVCCAVGETACGGRCCPAGNTCLQNQFCAPLGSTLCGNGQICNAPQTCAGGALCCDAGASFCGGGCCPSTSQCQAGTCLAAGQTLCGTTVCAQGQTCQGGTVCCDTTATFCNNACCPSGNTCINNQCVAQGSIACGPTVCQPNTICGNPQTGLCCQGVNQFGCGNACCNSFTQLCDQYRQVCTNIVNTQCTAGTQWCPGAQICCPVGQVCTFNQCTPRSTIAGVGGVGGIGGIGGIGRRRLNKVKGIASL